MAKSSATQPHTPRQIHTPEQLVDALHTAFGRHHARAVHAKGIITEGTFEPDAHAAALTRASHLQRTSSKVVLRFSNFTGIPDIPDNIAQANPRGLGVRFTLPNGLFTDVVAHSFNGFPTATSDDFHDLLMAISLSGPAAPKPTALDQYLARHPIAARFLSSQKTPASYATIGYYAANAFQFITKDGASSYIRYQFIPDAGEHVLAPEELAAKSPEYLIDEIKERIAQHPIRFKFYAQVSERGDRIDDPSIAWPDRRKRVQLGIIALDKLGENTVEQDQALAFSPNNLLDGIKAADPMLDSRSAAYPISVKERRD